MAIPEKNPAQKTDRKLSLRQLIAADKLEEAIRQLLAYTESSQYRELYNASVVQSGKLEHYLREMRMGTADYAVVARAKANISVALLDIIDHLPEAASEQAKSAASSSWGIGERTLKRHILILMLLVKLIIVAYLYVQWQAGGFTVGEFIATLSILIPVFTTYTGLMFKDAIRFRHVRHQRPHKEWRLTRGFQWTSYFLLIAYLVVLWIVIGLKPQGVLKYQQMTGLLALVESGLGVYVGQVIFALFKREEA